MILLVVAISLCLLIVISAGDVALTASTRHTEQDELRFIFSLGYKVGPDSDAKLGYTSEDVQAMESLVLHYALEKSTYGEFCSDWVMKLSLV
jgi:hypothetical protein